MRLHADELQARRLQNRADGLANWRSGIGRKLLKPALFEKIPKKEWGLVDFICPYCRLGVRKLPSAIHHLGRSRYSSRCRALASCDIFVVADLGVAKVDSLSFDSSPLRVVYNGVHYDAVIVAPSNPVLVSPAFSAKPQQAATCSREFLVMLLAFFFGFGDSCFFCSV